MIELRGNTLDSEPEVLAINTEQGAGGPKAQVKLLIIVLLTLYGPLTDEELCDRFETLRKQHPSVPAKTPQNIRTRRHELHVAGRVVPTGIRVRTRAGGTAALWQVNA